MCIAVQSGTIHYFKIDLHLSDYHYCERRKKQEERIKQHTKINLLSLLSPCTLLFVVLIYKPTLPTAANST